MALHLEKLNRARTKVVDSIPSPREWVPQILQKQPRKAQSKETPAMAELFTELYRFDADEPRKRLILHQLQALTAELMQLPFYHSAMVIHSENPDQFPYPVSLHDEVYADSSVIDRCLRAIDAAQKAGNQTLESRYRLELAQVENLHEMLLEVIPELSWSSLSALSDQNLTILPERVALLDGLARQGWLPANNVITDKVSWQLNIKKNTTCWVGPKFMQIMTRSPAHKHHGWKTMYNLCQPAYFPEYGQWVVLQDQHMADSTWNDYDEILTLLHADQPATETPAYLVAQKNILNHEPIADREARVMSATVPLNPQYQTQSSVEVFKDIIYRRRARTTQLKEIEDQEEALTQQYQKLATTFETHADYLLGIMGLEAEWADFQTLKTSDANMLSMERNERLFQAFLNTFSSIYHQKLVTQSQLTTVTKKYKELYQVPENRQQAFELRDVFRLASASSLAHVALAVESLLECTLLSLPSAVQELSTASLQAMGMNELAQLIGHDRALKWKNGHCIKCGHDGLVGECSLCLGCEKEASAKPSIGLAGLVRGDDVSIMKSESDKNAKAQAA